MKLVTWNSLKLNDVALIAMCSAARDLGCATDHTVWDVWGLGQGRACQWPPLKETADSQ